MDVILDTNVLFSLLQAQGGNFTNSNAFVELVTYLRRTKSDLVMPQMVVDELCARYQDFLSGLIKKSEDARETLQHKTFTNLINIPKVSLATEVQALRERLLNPAQGFQSRQFDDYGAVSIAEVVRRGIHRVPPASSKGEELRDVVLWLLVLAYAKTVGQEVAFISGDGTFQNPDGTLKEQLANDVAGAGVKIACYESIRSFIAANSLLSSSLNERDLDKLVALERLSRIASKHLFNANIDHGIIVDVQLLNIQFRNAQQYQVGSNSFYIESEYTVTARLRILQPNNIFIGYAPIDPQPVAWQSSGTMFGRLGANLQPPPPNTVTNVLSPSFPSLQQTQQTPTRLTYNATLTMQISLRVTDGKRESLEIDNMALDSKTIIQEPAT